MMRPNIRRLLAVVLFGATVAFGKGCEQRTCTGYREVGGEWVETTVTGARCEHLHDILDDLRQRDPGGDIDLSRRN